MKRSVCLTLAIIFSVSACTKHVSTDPSDTDPVLQESGSVSEPVSFVMFADSYEVKEKSSDNEIMNLITEKTGVKVKEVGITGTMNTSHLADDMIYAAESIPDFLYMSDAHKFYENDLLVAWDPYLIKYSELKALHTDEEWDRLRQSDGHIYWADFSDCQYQKDTTVYHEGEAFWIQVRVLEWAGYPVIETLDEYFDLLESYAASNPEMPDGSTVIPYACLRYNLGYRTLGKPPAYLDGYQDNGDVSVIQDENTGKPVVIDYNTSDTAKTYFKKLNGKYHEGVLDNGFSDDLYHDYLDKILSGRALGFFDQYRSIEKVYTNDTFSKTLKTPDGSKYTLREIGCDYVPLALVNEKGMPNHYHSYNVMNMDKGLMVTKKCKDPDKAFEFFCALLSQDIHDLRFWGIEGTDYLISDDGLYYRTDEMRDNWDNNNYIVDHTCEYSFLPHWHGMSRDGVNRMLPGEQPSEFKSRLAEPVIKCFDAYNVENYVDMLGSVNCAPYPSNPLTDWPGYIKPDDSSALGNTWNKIDKCKDEWLVQLIMCDDFDSTWNEYLAAYEACNPQVFLDEAQNEADRRCG